MSGREREGKNKKKSPVELSRGDRQERERERETGGQSHREPAATAANQGSPHLALTSNWGIDAGRARASLMFG